MVCEVVTPTIYYSTGCGNFSCQSCIDWLVKGNVFANVSEIKCSITLFTQKIVPLLDSIKHLVFTVQGNRTVVILPTMNICFNHVKFTPSTFSVPFCTNTFCFNEKSQNVVLFQTLRTSIKLNPRSTSKTYNSTEVKTI